MHVAFAYSCGLFPEIYLHVHMYFVLECEYNAHSSVDLSQSQQGTIEVQDSLGVHQHYELTNNTICFHY